MEEIIKTIFRLIGLNWILEYLKNPTISYTPCIKSCLSMRIMGDDANVSIEIEFKGKYRDFLDDTLSEGNLLKAYKFNIFEDEKFRGVFKDQEFLLDEIEGLRDMYVIKVEKEIEENKKKESEEMSNAVSEISNAGGDPCTQNQEGKE